jgi:hypothetical protein
LSETAHWYANGIGYDGTDTFEILTSGVYSLTCVLSLDDGNPPDSCFYIEVNGTAPVASSSSYATTGQITIIRVGYHVAGTTLRIVNASDHAVTLKTSTRTNSGAGHLSMFAFADNGIINLTSAYHEE